MMLERPFGDVRVRAAFDSYPDGLRADLLALRALILATARETEGVGALVETLKWGQPAHLPARPGIGTTIRIDVVKGEPARYAMYVHCQTTLMASFRERYGDAFAFEGNRALIFARGARVPRAALRHCIAMALTYHARQRRR
jgi:hypothetical protein